MKAEGSIDALVKSMRSKSHLSSLYVSKCFQDDYAERPFKTGYELGRNVLSRSTCSTSESHAVFAPG